VGVDIFFVISGFLISTIIFENIEAGTFSFRGFYIRRIRRIFPSLIIILLTSYFIGWFFLLADEYKQLGKHIAAGAGFVSNVVLWKNSGYFDSAAEMKPLLHLWSLAIEEQFYIVWPLLVWFSWKRNLNLLTVTVLLLTTSFVLNLVTIQHNAIMDFYAPQTRFWELLVGSVLAQAAIKMKETLIPQTPISQTKTVTSFLGLILIGLSFFYLNKGFPFPGKWAAIPVIGATLIIWSGPQAWVNRAILSRPVFVWIGLISFPLYLWHWPLISFANITFGDDLSVTARMLIIVVSLLLAWLTYRFIEKPVRSGNSTLSNVKLLLVLILVVGSLGKITALMDGFGFRNAFTRISEASLDWQYPGSLQKMEFDSREYRFQTSGLEEITVFVGDSNITQYYARVDELIKTNPQKTNSVVFVSGGGCMAIPSTAYNNGHESCHGLAESALNFALHNNKVRRVVIGGLWNAYLGEGSNLVGDFGHGSDDYYRALNNLSQYISELRKHDIAVTLILSIPSGDELDPKYMVERTPKNFPDIFSLRSGGIQKKLLDDKYGRIQDDLKRVAEEADAEIIEPTRHLCKNNFCPSVFADKQPLYKDNCHLSQQFVRYHANFIDSTVTR